MKQKFTLGLVSIVLTFTACNSAEDVNAPNLNEEEGLEMVMTPQEALEAAQRAASEFYPAQSRSNGMTASINNVKPVYKSLSRTDADMAFYVVNFDNDNGFAFINPNKYGAEVIGISDKGNYNLTDKSKNPEGLNDMVDYIVATSVGAGGMNPPTIYPGLKPWYDTVDTLLYDIVEPKVEATWNQTGYFGKHCSNGIAGCVPVAVGMSLSYLGGPENIKLNFANAPVSKIDLPWSLLKYVGHPQIYESGSFTDVNGFSAKDLVGLLLRELGHRMGSVYYDEYSSGGVRTGTQFEQIQLLISNLMAGTSSYCMEVVGYTSKFSVPKNTIKNNIAIVTAKRANGNAHAWIADGYRDVEIKYSSTIESTTTGIATTESETVKYYYVHMNWGWGGVANGYFDPNVLDTNKILIKDYKNLGNADVCYDHDFHYLYVVK